MLSVLLEHIDRTPLICTYQDKKATPRYYSQLQRRVKAAIIQCRSKGNFKESRTFSPHTGDLIRQSARMVRAWLMDESQADQRLEHQRSPPEELDLGQLFLRTGVEYFKVRL